MLRPEPIQFISYPYEWSFGQLRDAALLTLEHPGARPGPGHHPARRQRLQRPVPGGPPGVHRHALLRAAEGGRALGGVPAVLRALPGAARAHEPGGHRPRRPAPHAYRRYPARARQHGSSAAATWRSLGPPVPRAPPRHGPAALPRPGAPHGRPAPGDGADGAGPGPEPPRPDRAARPGIPAAPSGPTTPTDNNYSAEAAASKRRWSPACSGAAAPATVWDLGANTGDYSRAARAVAGTGRAFDIDPAAVERNYRRVRADGERGILPLRMDLTNPSPALGWAHRERLSLEQRGPADALLALALVHHLAIGHNLPLERIAAFLPGSAARWSSSSCPRATRRCSGCCARAPTSSRAIPARASRRRSGRSFRIEDARARGGVRAAAVPDDRGGSARDGPLSVPAGRGPRALPGVAQPGLFRPGRPGRGPRVPPGAPRRACISWRRGAAPAGRSSAAGVSLVPGALLAVRLPRGRGDPSGRIPSPSACRPRRGRGAPERRAPPVAGPPATAARHTRDLPHAHRHAARASLRRRDRVRPAGAHRELAASALAHQLDRPIPGPAAAPSPARDVYLIVLDEYANADVLREALGFDNSRFVDSLRALGSRSPPSAATTRTPSCPCRRC